MIYVSYATAGVYEDVMEKHLHPSLHRWDLPHDITVIPDPKNWQVATHYKATFLKAMLEKHKQPVVFIDADGSVERFPVLFSSLNCDIALHILDWNFQWRNQQGNPKREYLSGTLYLNYSRLVLRLMDDWINLNKQSTDLEQRHLQKLLEGIPWKDLLTISNLRPEYCVIPMQSGKLPYHYLNGEKPVIRHYQVSRLHRNR